MKKPFNPGTTQREKMAQERGINGYWHCCIMRAVGSIHNKPKNEEIKNQKVLGTKIVFNNNNTTPKLLSENNYLELINY